ncbi:MAG: DNA polymerase IV [Candidatus Micrarchaeota archaeon]|nr:DNA polymerase IV [Candidatus Micrarchaeota archaeon]
MPLVLFLDMDYFFAACEESRHPDLKSKPLVVGTATIARKEKGVVQTCNYEARKFGIRSGMPTMQALRLDPDLVYLESDENFYEQVSGKVMEMLKSYGFKTEVISIDEAALDIGDISYPDAETLAKSIKDKINKDMQLPCTIGICAGKTYAKIVCDSAKPNGIGILKEQEIKQFLKDKGIGSILGVGRSSEARLRERGITTIGQLSKADPNVLIEMFGAFGRELFLLANGMDNSRVSGNYDAVLSIGRERTLESDTRDGAKIASMARKLSNEVILEVKKKGMWFKGISVKARYSDFTERIKNRKISNYADSIEALEGIALPLLAEITSGRSVRKVGVRVYMLEKRTGQRALV